LRAGSRGFEADGSDEGIEIADNRLIEAIELRPPLGFEPCVCFDWAEKTCCEWGIDAFEELQEYEADRVSVREELIAARVGEFGHKAFGTEFREVVAERGERVAFGGAAERFDDGGMDFGGGEGIGGCDVCEGYERMHHGELPRMIELEARNALSRRRDGRFRELSQLAAIDKGIQDILLDVAVVDRR
jgi:hypothetical protein